MSNVIELNDSNFNDEVVKSDKPVLVDFWAEWCGPCKMISPIVEEIAGDYNGKVKVGKVNVDVSANANAIVNVIAITNIQAHLGMS